MGWSRGFCAASSAMFGRCVLILPALAPNPPMSNELRSLIASVLGSMTHAELDAAPPRIAGLIVPNAEGLSKRQRVDAALENLTQDDLARLALKFGTDRGNIALDEAGRKVLEAGDPPLSHITRRDVARVFGDDLAGERSTVDMVERYFALCTPLDGIFGSGGRSLRDQIWQHMDRNPGDWSVEFLFGEIGAFDCSRARFAALLEDAVHPLARSGEAQSRTVAALNVVLARDGYELTQEGELSGHPIFAFRSLVRGVSGRPKNLIFASRGPKPEIGFVDAINNDIIILSGEESCLVYDRPIGPTGLLWSELVSWWSETVPGADAANLGARLQESLASDAERKLFATYFKAYRSVLGETLPALLPQVYLHYDPAVVKTLRHRLPLPRQRMDFLLLLPGRQRVVLEVDGMHHFSEGDHPSLKAYADMVSADRELRLAGYEVFRFGANELVGQGAEAKITEFFDKLFRVHRIQR
jgi:very-short-patch-repair endonuclease